MKFSQFGYTKETIEVRKMFLGSLVQTIAQGMIKSNNKDLEIRIVDCFAGEIDIYNGLDELLMKDFIVDWEISVYEMKIMHDNINDKDYIKVIIADNIEMEEEEI